MLPMAAAIRDPAVIGVKVLADVPENAALGLRTQNSSITLLDPATGHPMAFLDGVEIMLYRTAAASAVATRHLAREDVSTLGLIGAGAQARSHLAALRAVRDFAGVTVWSRTRETAERFAAEHRDCGLPVTVMDTPEEVVRSADVLCTLTPSREPPGPRRMVPPRDARQCGRCTAASGSSGDRLAGDAKEPDRRR